MPAISATAPGKVILFGEHAVVYGRPAIAVPVNEVGVKAYILALPALAPDNIKINAPGIQLKTELSQLSSEHPFTILFATIKKELKLTHYPAFQIKISSNIPVAAGMGSGAAVSVAIIRAITTFLGISVSPSVISKIAFEVEKVYHGNPSGIDNTVIAFQQPIYYLRSTPLIPLRPKESFNLLVADSGIPASTHKAVSFVQERWNEKKDQYNSFFDSIGEITNQARRWIEDSPVNNIGPLMTQNHQILKKIGVSNSILDNMVETALNAGALGAKLCGAGTGGNMVALVSPSTIEPVIESLAAIGISKIYRTKVEAYRS